MDTGGYQNTKVVWIPVFCQPNRPLRDFMLSSSFTEPYEREKTYGFRDWGLGFGVWGLEFIIQRAIRERKTPRVGGSGSGVRCWGLGIRTASLACLLFRMSSHTLSHTQTHTLPLTHTLSLSLSRSLALSLSLSLLHQNLAHLQER
jgi:hypothetical protein